MASEPRYPSGSRIGLAMKCVGSAVLPRVESLSVAADAGTAKHRFAARLVAGVDKETALSEVQEEFREACDALDVSWLPLVSGCETEVTLAFSPSTGVSTRIGANLERDYSGAASGEMVATLDYFRVGDAQEPPSVFVADLKTGMIRPDAASTSWQLRTCALFAARLVRAECADIAIIWTPEGRKPVVDKAHLTHEDLVAIETQLCELASRIDDEVTFGGTPQLRTGDHCKYCPAKLSCPAQVGIIRSAVATGGNELTAMAARVATMTTGELSSAYLRAKPFLDAASALRKAFADAAMVQPFAVADGVSYGLRKTERKTYDGAAVFTELASRYGTNAAQSGVSFEASVASIERGLKAAKAEGKLSSSVAEAKREVLAVLYAAGAVEVSESSRLCEYPDPSADMVR